MNHFTLKRPSIIPPSLELRLSCVPLPSSSSLPQTKQRWTAARAPRTQSSTTSWSSCSPATVRWRSGSPVPSASTTTSSWSSSVDTPPALTAALHSRPAPSAGRLSGSASSSLSELLSHSPLSFSQPKEDIGRSVSPWGGVTLVTCFHLSRPPTNALR